MLFRADGTEVARAEEGSDVALGVASMQQSKAREAQIRGQFLARKPALALIEHGRVVGQFPGLSRNHFMDAYGLLEEQAQVKEAGR